MTTQNDPAEVFSLAINYGGEALDHENAPENIAKMLEEVAREIRWKIGGGSAGGRINDPNGNEVGEWGYAPQYSGDTVEWNGRTYSISERPDMEELTPIEVMHEAIKRSKHETTVDTYWDDNNHEFSVTLDSGAEVVASFEHWKYRNDGRLTIVEWSAVLYDPEGEEVEATEEDINASSPHRAAQAVEEMAVTLTEYLNRY